MNSGNLSGKMLGNRYEILEKIGTGGMATVYKAKCHLLNRFVAVKVLREELKGDEEIVKKFHVESQSAASLSHHNIVSVYDVGEEDGNSYIVMEYVDGITLKEYIKQKGMLDWREACRFAESICSALDHAHKKHIIHRDIKPHNILMTHDNVLKVADFGIARAVSSETLVAGSAAFGSVHYISPEQARGGYTDERSDIYSMGIMLYEMLTGKVPFNAENAVSVAIMHIEKEAEDVRTINPQIPDSVAAIVMKAISKEQRTRYQTAGEMQDDLRRAINSEPLTVSSAEKKDMTSDEIVKKIIVDNSEAEGAEMDSKKKGRKTKKVKTEQQKKEDRLAVIFAAVTIVIILAIMGGTYLFMRGGSREVIVPDLLNMTLEEAQKAVEGTDFTINEKYEEEESEDVEEGKIISQDPGANQSVKKNTEISLVISIGSGKDKDEIKVIDVVEMDYDAAVKALKEKGLKAEKIEETSDTVAEGAVIRQDPEAGEKAGKDDKVKLYVSSGSKEKYIVPDLDGSTRSKAESALKSAGLQLGSVTREESDKPEGTVISQKPAKDSEVSKNSFVNIVLSAGKAQESEPTPTPASQPQNNQHTTGNSNHTGGSTNQAPEKTPVPTSTPAPAAKQKVLTIVFPDSVGETVNVKVVANGKVIHNADHAKSEGGTRITVKGSKDANVEIYLDGTLTEQKTISFD